MITYTNDEIFDLIRKKYLNQKIIIFSPVVKSRKGSYKDLFVSIKKQGFNKVRVDDEIIEIYEGMELDRYKIHNIEILIDKFTIDDLSLIHI